MSAVIDASIAAALDAHNAVRGFDLDGEEHAIVMFLADLIDHADRRDPRLDIDALLQEARVVVADCKEGNN